MRTAGSSQWAGGRGGGSRSHFIFSLVFLLVLPVFSLGASVSAQRMLGAKFPEVQFNDVALQDVMDYLRQSTGVNFFVDWKALGQVGVTPTTTVALKLHDMPLSSTLTFVLRSAGGTTPLSWYVDQNVIQITARAAADTQMVTRVYPIRELLMVIPDFSDAPTFDLSQINKASSGQSGGGGGGSGNLFGNTSQQKETTITPQQRAQELIQMITQNVRPDIWRQNGGPASITYFNGDLIVTAPRDVQKMIGGR